MTEMSELLDVVNATAAALHRHGIEYFVTDSFASSVHGEFRATNDIDIVTVLDEPHLESWLTELSATFLTDLDQAREALAIGGRFNLIHSTTYLKVDVFPCVSAFNHEAIRRAVAISLPGASEPLPVASLEDIILSKLWWFRLGRETSETQQHDVRRLIALNRVRLDAAYLEQWATELKVDDLLSVFRR
ncbi:hypothetical protein [Gemmatimonas sp.]|uniref:hypothetical protein n=1 Tax=Gemmatimonas sp. TaxID=1962908 RepID=UPI0035617718